LDKPLISHVGIAVKELDSAIARWKLISGNQSPVIEDVADQKVRVAMFSTAGGSEHIGGRVELVAATSPDSPIARFIEKNGEGLHHICIYVDDIEAKLRELKAEGVRLIDELPRIGAEGKRIAFVHPSSMGGVLIELEER
jgi:methylmalonyl-CoA/ethylmalonyl-CoA epimerase